MAATASAETRELSLVEKVEFRFALADTDAKLEILLKTYLPPLLLKLGSEHASVRTKVISSCQHINTRVKPRTIQLPVAALLKQFKNNSESALIRHFDLLYAQQGIARLTAAEQADLLPTLISGISTSNASAAQGSIIFNLLLRSLVQYHLPPKGSPASDNLRTQLGVSKEDIDFLSHWFGKLLLLRSPNGQGQDGRANPGIGSQELAYLTMEGKPEAWTPSKEGGLSLSEVKLKVLALLSSGLFQEDERLFPALLASSDQNSRIADVGEDMLKHSMASTDFENDKLVEKLYSIYFGVRASESSSFVPAVSARLRTRILGLLTRATISSRHTQLIIRLVEEDLLQDFMVTGEAAKTDREVARLRAAIITFLTLTARRSSKKDLDALSRPVIKSLRLFIEQEAQQTRSSEIRQVRGQSFEIIGLLAAADVELIIEPELELLTWLFRCLGEEPDKEMLVSIDQALSSLLRSFLTHLSPEVEKALTGLLLQNVRHHWLNQRNVRYASLRFANRCLPFQDVIARFIDISVLGSSADASHEAIEEAKLGLDPYRYTLSHAFDETRDSSSKPLAFPNFQDLVDYIFWSEEQTEISEVTVQSLVFCRQALIWNALLAQSRPLKPSTDWDRRLDVEAAEDLEGRAAIRRELSSLADNQRGHNALVTLFNTAIQAFASDRITLPRRRQAGSLLVELCTLLPDSMLTNLASKHLVIRDAVLSNDQDCRNAATQSFALLAARLTSDRQGLEQSLTSFAATISDYHDATGSKANQASGALQAVAGYVSRRLYLDSNDSNARTWLDNLLPALFGVMRQSTDSTLLSGAFVALSQLCIYQVITEKQASSYLDFPTILETLWKPAHAGNEKAIAALGHMALILRGDNEYLAKAVDKIYELHDIKQAETQFAVGEALACAACGWDSTALMSKLDLDAATPISQGRSKTFDVMLERVIANTGLTKPSLKKASVLWLLCFVQFCGARPEVQSRLRKLQAIFKRCLSDREELIQESASRGLGLLYEKGSRELKDDLVRDLVSSFSSDRADTSMSGSVSEDTQLFEPGALPTGEGQSVSTYKDIMSLASEVGDSSLVYRFMNLASSDALWSSRAAFGRFGLSSVLSDSSVDGYLANNPKLYPKLYRYRFDSTPKVRAAMTEIWNALVPNPTETVDKYFGLIMQDLLDNILAREWRVRQACCAALADLIQGRELTKINPYLEKLWTLCAKVLDDIKQSVRKSATDLSRVLSNLIIRALEADNSTSANANKMLESVIPFLFSSSGLESSAEEVQASSLVTLIDITKKAKASTLRPFIPDLVDNLIGLLTTLEHQAINYLYLNASKYNLEESDIDNKRLQGVRSSPLMEAIERCIDALDEDSMSKLAARLQLSMKAAVGTPSKVGCALILVNLSTRKSFLFKAHADTFLKVIPRHMNDRNETVSQSYAAALGYAARGASEDSIIRVAAIARRLYFEAEDEKPRLTSAEVVRAIAKYSTDRFAALGSEFLPFVFFARHDNHTEVQKLFNSVWDDNTGGSRAASLYCTDIVKLVNEHLMSARWTIKHAAALAVSDLVISLASAQSAISTMNAQLLWAPLKQALAEKTWEGKEKLLDGFATFVAKAPIVDLGIEAEVHKIIIREAKRKNLVYQSFSIGCLAAIALRRVDLDLHEDACSVIGSAIVEYSLDQADSDRMEIDGDSTKRGDSTHEGRLRSSAVDVLFNTVNVRSTDLNRVVRQIEKSLDLVCRLAGSTHSASQTQSAITADIKRLAEDLTTRSDLKQMPIQRGESAESFQHRLVLLLFQHDLPAETARLARAAAATALTKLVLLTNHAAGTSLRSKLESALRQERSSAVKESLSAALRQLA